MAKLTLSTGSNVGDRSEHLARARQLLEDRLGQAVYVSPVIESKPWGVTDQADFLNQILVLELDAATYSLAAPETRTTAHRILDHCQSVERKLGRERRMRWGPRTIDIDLIFLEDLLLEDERLSLPHPWWQHRSFVTDLLPDRYGHPR